MSVKEALNRLKTIRENRIKNNHGDKIDLHNMEYILEGLAEPNEGELAKIKSDERKAMSLTELTNAVDEMLKTLGCSLPDVEMGPKPAFRFGDLVEEKGGRRAIFQRYTTDLACWVLGVDSIGDFVGYTCKLKDLKLIQRGDCDVSLDRIRKKLIKG